MSSEENVSSRITALEQTLSETTTKITHLNERVHGVETNNAALQTTLEATIARLENKIDNLAAIASANANSSAARCDRLEAAVVMSNSRVAALEDFRNSFATGRRAESEEKRLVANIAYRRRLEAVEAAMRSGGGPGVLLPMGPFELGGGSNASLARVGEGRGGGGGYPRAGGKQGAINYGPKGEAGDGRAYDSDEEMTEHDVVESVMARQHRRVQQQPQPQEPQNSKTGRGRKLKTAHNPTKKEHEADVKRTASGDGGSAA